MAVQKLFKRKLSELVKSLRSTSQVEAFNSLMVQIWGSWTNLSPPLADFKLSELGTRQNVRIMGELKGLPTPPVTDLRRMADVRALRRDLGMPDKYKVVPCEEDLPSLADATPFGFEAMQLQLDPEATNVLLEGSQDL